MTGLRGLGYHVNEGVSLLFSPPSAGFFVSEIMDEDELERYLDQIDAIDPLLKYEEGPLEYFLKFEQLRDEYGVRVPGCYRKMPCRVYDDD